ncbi:MAG: hypothetical protein HDQ88_00275 [Clostridia bacterium]|nr:hypothetical protein [Clostridia bacterium]
MNVSLFYGKKTVSTDGKRGYIISVNAYAGKIECLVCADEDENEFIIDAKSIKSYGDKIIYEDRATAMKRAKPVRLGRASYDDNGKYLGCIEEFTCSGAKILKAKIGKKSYPADKLIYGDVIIAKTTNKLKSDVVKGGKVIIKKGTPVTEEVLETAKKEGEYVQASLKSI